MPLQLLESKLEQNLRNEYYALRHGTSEANKLGIIASDPAICIHRYGLVDEGREEVRHSVEDAFRKNPQLAGCRIFSSPFRRTFETAQIAREILKSPPITTSSLLEERYFGDLEGQSNQFYQRVWDLDEVDAHHNSFAVETAYSVRNRVVALINELEQEYRNGKILLVSHGDAIQIGQTAFEGISPAQHRRKIRHISPGELRKLSK